MGVTFCAVAAEHPLAVHAAASSPAIAAFIESCKTGGTTEAELATQEKKGIATGLFVSHPLTHEPIEVWVGNYVLMSYGDGAVMGVPAHDERDFAFAKKYGIDILQVVHFDDEPHFTYDHWQEWYGAEGSDRRARRDDQLRSLQRPVIPGRGRCGGAGAAPQGPGATSRRPGGCATGA